MAQLEQVRMAAAHFGLELVGDIGRRKIPGFFRDHELKGEMQQ
jgi:hypothetical protein